MAHFGKLAEGSWTEHFPELGTSPISYEDSISLAGEAVLVVGHERDSWVGG